MTDLRTTARQLTTTAAIVERLADVAEETRTSLPPGYTAGPDRDGVARPVEAVVVALDDRGVLDALGHASRALTQSVNAAADAARLLDDAISRWEGNPK